MHPYQERVINEKKELDEKLNKLNEFILSEPFRSLPEREDQLLLKLQLKAMKDYSFILSRRIERFSSPSLRYESNEFDSIQFDSLK